MSVSVDSVFLLFTYVLCRSAEMSVFVNLAGRSIQLTTFHVDIKMSAAELETQLRGFYK